MNREELIKDIEAAFENVLLENGIGVYESVAMEDYTDQEEIERERARDRQSWLNWQDIPDEILSKYYSVLCFVDPQGMKYLLPAFMRFTVKNFDMSNSLSLDSAIYILDNGLKIVGGDADFLTKPQKSAIAKFLKFMLVEAGDKYIHAGIASRAYEQHWSKYEQATH